MIGQRQRHAVAQSRLGNLVLRVQQDAAVAAIAQFPRVQLAKGLDQIGLAVEIHRVLVGDRFHLVDPDRAAAFRLRREIARLAPFQGFLQCADALGGLCGVEDQAPQRQQFGLERFWIGLESRIDRGVRRFGRTFFRRALRLRGLLRRVLHPRSRILVGKSGAIRAWIGAIRYLLRPKRFRRRRAGRPGTYRHFRTARRCAG